MLKIIIKSPEGFIWLSKFPILRAFFSISAESLFKIKDDELYTEVVTRMRYGDVTGKATEVGRFDDLNEILELLPDKVIQIHDVGCSLGVTSLDLANALKERNKSFCLTISDRFLLLLIYGKGIKYLFDSTGSLRQIYLGRILCDQHLSKIFFVSRILYKILSAKQENDLMAGEAVTVRLVNPSVQKEINSGQMEIKSYNVFEKDNHKNYDFIRCMNLLNRSYFSDEEILVGLNNLADALGDKGYLQVGRTDYKGVNKVSVFKKESETLVLVKQHNGGAEIEDIIKQLCLEQ